MSYPVKELLDSLQADLKADIQEVKDEVLENRNHEHGQYVTIRQAVVSSGVVAGIGVSVWRLILS